MPAGESAFNFFSLQFSHLVDACRLIDVEYQRKTRCDAGLPGCGPCDRMNKLCEYFDAAKGKTIPRTYVIHLQNKVQSLEIELARLEEERHTDLDAEATIRSAGLVRFKEHDDYRYL